MKDFYVTAFRFSKDGWSYPRRIEVNGISYTLVDHGLCMKVKSAGMLCQILTMTDGARIFRLRSQDRGSNWTLVKVA